MVNAVFDGFNVSVKHRRICFQPVVCGLFPRVRAIDHHRICDRKSVSESVRQISPHRRPDTNPFPPPLIFDNFFVRHFVKSRKEIKFNHRQSLQMKFWKFAFQGRKQIRVIFKRQFRVQTADNVQFRRTFITAVRAISMPSSIECV